MSSRTIRSCVIPSCTSADRLVGEVSYHGFPSNKISKDVWIARIQEQFEATLGPNWQPTSGQKICSRHFDTSFLYTDPLGAKRLKKLAIPALHLAPLKTLEVFVDSNKRSEPVSTPDELISGLDCPSTPKRPKPQCSKQLFSIGSSPISVHKDASHLLTPTGMRKRAEHSYCKSPSRVNQEIKSLKQQLLRARIQIVNLKKKLARRNTKLDSVHDKISKLSTISLQQKAHLQLQLPGIVGEIFKNQQELNRSGEKKGMAYSKEIQKFAVTLHFYSPRAYTFLRRHLALPHPYTLASWMDGTDCGPGYNMRVLTRLSEARNNINFPTALTDVAMMCDEMSIRKDLVWNPKVHNYVGHVDFGTGDCEGAPLATNALVCMISSLCGGVKIPIGYIFTDKVNGAQLKTFLSQGFILLEQFGFTVHTLTADGCTTNVAAFKEFGVIEDARNPYGEDQPIRYEDIVHSFKNPANPAKTVYAMYDIVHMMKLWRNMLAETNNVTWEKGVVDFKYVRLLHELQSDENILAANTLSKYHIDFERHKMKVKYAVQALSRSVADALTFCRVDLKLPQFQSSEATEDFILLLDKFFDICNSRHPNQSFSKSPIRLRNLEQTIGFLQSFCSKLLTMTCTETRKIWIKVDGNKTQVVKATPKFLCRSLRKRAPLGCIISAKSLIDVCSIALYREVNPMKYVMTYRFSQDLLELFFNKVRGRLGRNNNPTALEFTRIMIHVWHQNLLKSNGTGNCLELTEEGEIPGGLLPLQRNKVKHVDEEIGDFDCDGFEYPPRSEFYKNCLSYIGGSIIRSIAPKIECSTCIDGLFNNPMDAIDEKLVTLIRRKQYGSFSEHQSSSDMKGLLSPCRSVFVVIEKTDALFRGIIAQHEGIPNVRNLDLKICIEVLNLCLGENLFPHLSRHVLDFDPTDFSCESHLSLLIKAIVKQFLKIRLYSHGKRFMKSTISTRHSLNKLTLFSNF